mmetsp:Transcript_24689/g.52589  ORF Transcript_24689/g.52589 Transcript_24689/m.52589 type:complete len:82 (-) Transcript_24689:1179-1424(-)
MSEVGRFGSRALGRNIDELQPPASSLKSRMQKTLALALASSASSIKLEAFGTRLQSASSPRHCQEQQQKACLRHHQEQQNP